MLLVLTLALTACDPGSSPNLPVSPANHGEPGKLATVPEPSTFALAGLALLALGIAGRRKNG